MRTNARAARASAPSRAERQSRAIDVITTVPELSVFSSTLATFVHATARTVDVRQLHLGARYEPGEAAHHEAHATHREFAQLRTFRIAGLKEHMHD